MDVRAYKRIECGSDHYRVQSKIKISFEIQSTREKDGIGTNQQITTHTRDKTYLFRGDSIQILYQRKFEATLENQHAEIPPEPLYQLEP